MAKIQARTPKGFPLSAIVALYGREWEDCEGTDGLTQEECRELITQWVRDDRLTARELGFPRAYGKSTEYRIEL